jgi:hypothetical protein
MSWKSIFHDVLVKQTINAQVANNTTVNGTVIDLAGYEGAAFEFDVGATDIALTVKVQAGTLADGSDMADVAGLSQAYTATDDGKPTVLDLNKPTKRYARGVAVIGAGTLGANVAALANLYSGRVNPQTQIFGGAFVTGI